MRVSPWIASRLRIGAGSSRSARTGAWIAVAGVALALAIMEFTMAVVAGFRDEIRGKVLGFDAEVVVLPPYDPSTGISAEALRADSALMNIVSLSAPGARVALAVQRPAVIKTDSDFTAVYFSACDPSAHDFAFERSCVVDGRWPDFAADSARDQIVISRATAESMQLAVADRPMLYFVSDGGTIRSRRATVAGIFDSRMQERDRATAYASLPMLQSAGGLEPGWGTRIEIRGIGVDSATVVADRLQAALVSQWQADAISELYPVDNVRRSGAVYLNWLDLLDTNVVVIFILMLLVAASTLVAALFIIVLEHIPTIGLLRAIGATRSMVRSVFIAASMRLVVRGMLAGNIVGLGLLLLQRATRIVPLDPEMYYLDHVPVAVDWLSVLALNSGVAAAAWLVLIVPSGIASRVDPARTMRYE
ncbi:MAG: ABC transporter permease [Muribaculaceae bacterium]|nr:ABC transporter permease [Muribaculaceae bacterium]